MTTSEILQSVLLQGKYITKFDFMNLTPTHSVCLAQRVQELREQGWNILDRLVPGKGTLKEYYLEESEIKRLTQKNADTERFGEEKSEDEQLLTKEENVCVRVQNEAQIKKDEQLGFGLLGGHNY